MALIKVKKISLTLLVYTKQKNEAYYVNSTTKCGYPKFIQKNRRSVPSKERIADKDKFIKTVYELSNSFEIDADLIEFAEGYIANIYVDYACYTGYIKKLLAILFILADDISFLDGSKENAYMLFSFTYHTHHIFLNNRETTDFS